MKPAVRYYCSYIHIGLPITFCIGQHVCHNLVVLWRIKQNKSGLSCSIDSKTRLACTKLMRIHKHLLIPLSPSVAYLQILFVVWPVGLCIILAVTAFSP